MGVLIDADGCPVVDITVRLCREYKIPCLILCDTAHEFRQPDIETLIVDKGSDSVDYAIANRVQPGDIVVTQDYGLAAMCLARQASVVHQDGWMYTARNIDQLLYQRHTARKLRNAGVPMKGPKKRTRQQDAAFEAALKQLLTPQSRDTAPAVPDQRSSTPR